ncbi:MAG TPA: chaperone modulator CbpM [Chloroflexota bacterium]|nr:chaperone modulator CbpM [Chloroflexota bacterium]
MQRNARIQSGSQYSRAAYTNVDARAEATSASSGTPPTPEVVGPRTYTEAMVCAVLRITPATLRRYRAAGLIVPMQSVESSRTRGRTYDEDALLRLRTAHRLIRDLGVNLAGASVALHLLDQLAAVQRELSSLESRFQWQVYTAERQAG